METFLKNKTFEIEFNLIDSDDDIIDLSLLLEITVVIRKINGGMTLVTKKLSSGGVVIKDASAGICSIYINKLDTIYAEAGTYEYVITPESTDTDYTGDLATPAGFDKCFILK
jgi:hypothetical protein